MFGHFCGACVVTGSDGSWAVYWCTCRSKGQGASRGREEVSDHGHLRLGPRGGGETQSD